MTNEITLVLIGSILLGLGALVGALIYHLIIFKFSKNLEKVLEKTIKNYEHYVLEKATNSLDEFQSIRNQLNNISTNIIKEQKIFINLQVPSLRILPHFLESSKQAKK